MVEKRLEAHRNGFPPGAYIFVGERLGRSLNLENLAMRVIAPKLKEAGVKWAGWHSFRRGLATNLYAIGVDEWIIRTSAVTPTLKSPERITSSPRQHWLSRR